MSLFLGRRGAAVIRALPDVFILQPSSNYQALISHSAQELTVKSQKLVSKQMRSAFSYAGRRVKNER